VTALRAGGAGWCTGQEAGEGRAEPSLVMQCNAGRYCNQPFTTSFSQPVPALLGR
jgi:hypothetical protein